MHEPAAPAPARALRPKSATEAESRGSAGDSPSPRSDSAVTSSPDTPKAAAVIPAGKEPTDEAAAARGKQRTRALMEKGNYRDAAASLREVMRVAPSDPEARQLAVELNASQRKVADQALDQMTAARSKAEQWAAGKFASKSFEATLIQESEARALYNARRFEEAAQKFLVTSGLYLGAAEAADSEKAAQDAKTKLADQEKQKAQLFQLADLSRRSYEQEHLDAVREEAETKAADKYQDASRLAAEAQSKWDREDYAGAARSE